MTPDQAYYKLGREPEEQFLNKKYSKQKADSVSISRPSTSNNNNKKQRSKGKPKKREKCSKVDRNVEE